MLVDQGLVRGCLLRRSVMIRIGMVETIQSRTSVLNLSTNTMLNENEVVVTYGDHGNPEMNGIIHTAESCWNCSSTSINTTFRANSSFTASNSDNSSGYFVRITPVSAERDSSVIRTKCELQVFDIPYYTGYEHYRRKSIFLPAVSGTIITTGNLHDIVVNRLSANFPEDVIATGDVTSVAIHRMKL